MTILNIFKRCLSSNATIATLSSYSFLQLLLVVSIVFLSLLLGGCSSSASIFPNIYLISLAYEADHPDNANTTWLSNKNLPELFRNISRDATLEVRSGFFKICVSRVSKGNNWDCRSDVMQFSSTYGITEDPLNLIASSSNFRTDIVFAGLIIAAIVLNVLAVVAISTFPGWHTELDDDASEVEVKPFPTRALMVVILFLLTFSTIFVCISILWQHIASVAVAKTLSTVVGGVVRNQVGATSMALGWTAAGLVILATSGCYLTYAQVSILDTLVDEE